MERSNLLPKLLENCNLTKAVKLRELIGFDVVRPTSAKPIIHHFRTLHRHSLQVPDLQSYSSPVRDMVDKSLFDQHARRVLEKSGGLNWCKDISPLVPLSFTGDGNSLLHAISVYLWGVSDADMFLHKVLHEALTKTNTTSFKLRYQREKGKIPEHKLPHRPPDPEVWEEEWNKVVDTADPHTKGHSSLYNAYQDIYIFILANIIRRPIIVIAVKRNHKETASDSAYSFSDPSGIFLPLHWHSEECFHSPVILGHVDRIFRALVCINELAAEMDVFPLVKPTGHGLAKFPVRFLLDTEELSKKNLLPKYLDLKELSTQECSSVGVIPVSRLVHFCLPEDLNLMEDFFKLVSYQQRQWQGNSERDKDEDLEKERERRVSFSNLSITEDRCVNANCLYFCSKYTKPFCHECHQLFQQEDLAKAWNSKPNSPRRARKEPLSDRMTYYGRDTPLEIKLPKGPASAPPTASAISFFEETNVLKCQTEGCNITCSPAHNGLCSMCFLRSQVPALSELKGTEVDLFGGRCVACKQENRIFNGLCSDCLKGIQTSSTEGDPTKWMFPLQDQPQLGGKGQDEDQKATFSSVKEGEKCKTKDCHYFGTPEHSGYCTICYIANRENGLANPCSDQQPRISSRFQKMPTCLVSGCSMLGNPSYDGYCEKCHIFNQSKTNQGSRQHDPFSMTPPGRKDTQSHLEPPSALSGADALSGRANRNTRLEPWKTKSHHYQDPIAPHLAAQLNPEVPLISCKRSTCPNYGNVRCKGYCNGCYNSMRKQEG
uniref:ubiquitinyl hydrolase 1 n=1 Tax=Latimeria chalumnae TaxID=7897 RepID=H3B5R6_LATCH